MAGKAGTVYIKADRNVEVAKTSVMIGDVLKIECTDPAMLARIRSIHLLTFHHPDDKRQRRTVVSLLKVIQKIHEIYPDAAVENIGETDFIVTYEEQDGKGGIIHGVKIVAVVLISFFGAAFSTMAFNNDVGWIYNPGVHILYWYCDRDSDILQSFRKKTIVGRSDTDGGGDASLRE